MVIRRGKQIVTKLSMKAILSSTSKQQKRKRHPPWIAPQRSVVYGVEAVVVGQRDVRVVLEQ